MEELAASDAGGTGTSSAAVHRAEATAEFVYGTTAVIIALSGLEIVGGVPPESAALLTIAGAAAIWLCHAYAAYLGAHVVHGQAHASGEILGYLRRSAPIVLAAIPAALLLGGSVAGLWPVGTAIFAANVLAIVVLAVCGWIGARAARSSVAMSLGWAGLTACIGLGIVIVETLLHQ